MVTLHLQISGAGPANLAFTSGRISATHLYTPADESGLGIVVNNLQQTTLSLASVNGSDNTMKVDITEGPDPIWRAFTIDCNNGGSVSVGFPGSPTVRVNAGSFLGLEYNNANPAPVVTEETFS